MAGTVPGSAIPTWGFDKDQPGGWYYNTLPYVEQVAFHDIGAGQPAATKAALWTKAIATPLSLNFCPSRRPPMAGPLHPTWQTTPYPFKNVTYSSTMLVAYEDYAINGGPTVVPNPATPSPDGVAWCPLNTGQGKVHMADITDGTSNTYLVGERYCNPDSYYNGTDACGDMSPYEGHDWDICRWTAPAFYPRQDQPGADCPQCFGSARQRLPHGLLRRVGASHELHDRPGHPCPARQPPRRPGDHGKKF